MKGDMTSQEFLKSGLQLRAGRGGKIDYKAELLQQMKDAELPEPEREYTFHESRKWRFDYAFPELKVAVEYDGGIFDGDPSHSSVSGILRDIEKANEAQLAGWTILRVTAQSVSSGLALRYIKRAIEKAKKYDSMPVDKGKLAHIKRKLEGLIESIDS